MGRSPCCDKNGLKKGPWTPEEDLKLIQYIEVQGAGNWRTLPKNAGKTLPNPSFFQMQIKQNTYKFLYNHPIKNKKSFIFLLNIL